MSVVFRVLCDDSVHEIEITDSLEVVFLDHDVEFDYAEFQLGERPTECVQLLRRWEDNPINVIVDDLSLSQGLLSELALIWAEHFIPYLREQDGWNEEEEGDLYQLVSDARLEMSYERVLDLWNLSKHYKEKAQAVLRDVMKMKRRSRTVTTRVYRKKDIRYQLVSMINCAVGARAAALWGDGDETKRYTLLASQCVEKILVALPDLSISEREEIFEHEQHCQVLCSMEMLQTIADQES